MNTYRIEQISRKIEVSPKTKREYEKIGLKINGEWCNGFGKSGVTDKWDSGMEITGIVISDKEYNGKIYKNWSFVSLEERIAKLEEEVNKLKISGIKDSHSGSKDSGINDLPF